MDETTILIVLVILFIIGCLVRGQVAVGDWKRGTEMREEREERERDE